jgi:hypothetical protein
VSPTVMQQHEMPVFLLQQYFSIKSHVMTQTQQVHMLVVLQQKLHHHSHKSPLLHLLWTTITRVSQWGDFYKVPEQRVDFGMWYCVV